MELLWILLSVLFGIMVASIFPVLLVPLFIFLFIGLGILAFFVALPIFIVICLALIPIFFIATVINRLVRGNKCHFYYKKYEQSQNHQRQGHPGAIDCEADDDEK